jgi:hypothetical protein
MVEDAVNVDSINSFVVKFEVKDFSMFLQSTSIIVFSRDTWQVSN